MKNNENGLKSSILKDYNEEKKYSILKCMNKKCEYILSSPIPNHFIEKEKNENFLIESFFLIGAKISDNKNLKEDKKDSNCFLYKKVKCINCGNSIGRYILSGSNKYFSKIKKFEVKNYYAE